MKAYTVKELARLSGVTVRTLHHYDEIGLLKPALVGENRYRYYGREELLRLQDILFHRELGVPLQEVARALEQGGRDRLSVLEAHRELLLDRVQRSRQMIETIDRTIAELKGTDKMSDSELYKGFSREKQAEYEQWLVDEHGPNMRDKIEQGRERLEGLGEQGQRDLMAELAEIEQDLADAMRAGTDPVDPTVEKPIARHRAWVAKMGSDGCSAAYYAGLADLYSSHVDFRARYEAITPGFTDWLVAAMHAHLRRQSVSDPATETGA